MGISAEAQGLEVRACAFIFSSRSSRHLFRERDGLERGMVLCGGLDREAHTDILDVRSLDCHTWTCMALSGFSPWSRSSTVTPRTTNAPGWPDLRKLP